MERKLISVDIKSDFGHLKKNDINESIFLTYNALHKPALLGIFGAVIGLGGFSESFNSKKFFDEKYNSKITEYYEKLGELKVGIKPLSERGTFKKFNIKYSNTVGYANKDGNLLLTEQTLLKPSFRVFVLFENLNQDENERKLFKNLQNNESVFIPYLGKNEFQIWWENFTEYENFEDVPKSDYFVDSFFIKPKDVEVYKKLIGSSFFDSFGEDYILFENIPTKYDDKTTHYFLEEFVYTTTKLSNELVLDNLYKIAEDKYIQVF